MIQTGPASNGRATAAPHTNEETLVWTGILAKGGQVNKTPARLKVWKFNRVGFKSIEDGASHTILLAEKSVSVASITLSPTPIAWPFWEMYGYYTGADWPVMRMFGAKTQGTASPNPKFPYAATTRTARGRLPQLQEFGFGSAHPGIICSVFGDGATRIHFAGCGPDRARPTRKTRRPIQPFARQSLSRLD